MKTLYDFMNCPFPTGAVFVDSNGRRYSVIDFSKKDNRLNVNYGAGETATTILILHLEDSHAAHITPEEVDILARHKASKLE